MIRRPPTSTLFPSPPLSRSEDVCHRHAGGRSDERCKGHELARVAACRPIRDHQRRAEPGAGRHAEQVRIRQDRKSTRLNSSHSQISYAVFCLKKKKLHNSHPGLLHDIRGISKETTTGVNRLYEMLRDALLKQPALNVSDTFTKSAFVNLYDCL